MPQTTEQLRHKCRLLAVHWGMMSQRYPDKHRSCNFDPDHLRNHVDWLLGDNVAQLKAVTATGQEGVSPAWPVVLRYELELRKEAIEDGEHARGDHRRSILRSTARRRAPYTLLDHTFGFGRKSKVTARNQVVTGGVVDRQDEAETTALSAAAQSRQQASAQRLQRS